MVTKPAVAIALTLSTLLSACQVLSPAPTPTPLPTATPAFTPTADKPPTPRVITIPVTPTPDIAAYVGKQMKLQWAHRILDFLIMDAERISRHTRFVGSGQVASSKEAIVTVEQFQAQLANMDGLLLDVTPPDDRARQIRDAFLKYASKAREASTEIQGYYKTGDESRRARSNALMDEANALLRQARAEFSNWEKTAGISTFDYGSRNVYLEQWTR